MISAKASHRQAINDVGAIDLVLKLLPEGDRNNKAFVPEALGMLNRMASTNTKTALGAAIGRHITRNGMYTIMQVRVCCVGVSLSFRHEKERKIKL